jgi:hypothetical protein
VIAEEWRPIPGHPGYETNGVDFRGVDRIITRCNGVPYTVRGRQLKIGTHNPSGLPVVKLSNGRRGRGRWCFVHLLLAATFDDNIQGLTERPSGTSESAVA